MLPRTVANSAAPADDSQNNPVVMLNVNVRRLKSSSMRSAGIGTSYVPPVTFVSSSCTARSGRSLNAIATADCSASSRFECVRSTTTREPVPIS